MRSDVDNSGNARAKEPLPSAASGSSTGGGEYWFSSDPAEQQCEAIHAYLTRSYWAEGISLELVRRSVAGSLCCGVFCGGSQVGFARAVTDRATFAYLCDVYILEEHRGRGLAERLIRALLGHPDLQNLRRLMLVTRDAHGLYRKFGFGAPARPEGIMEISRPGLYRPRSPVA